MRRYGGLRTLLPITFATFGLGYLAIIGVPPFAGFFSKDGIIEAAFGAGGVKGLDPRRRRAARRGHHRVLHDPGDADDVLRRERRWKPTDRPHPHESPARDDVADDPAGRRLGRRRARCWRSAARCVHWLEPVVGAHESAPRRCRCGSITVITLAVVAGRHRDRLPHVRHPPVPDDAPDRGLGADRRRPPRPLRRRVQRGRVHASRRSNSPHGWSYVDDTRHRRRRRRARPRWSARDSERLAAACRPGSPAPTRCRCWPVRRSCRRDDPGW